MENFIHIADKPEPPRTNGDPGQQLAQHRANPQS